MKKEARLRNSAEPLQISYPADYAGEKSGSADDAEFFISTTPKLLTCGEIELVNQMLPLLPYRQYLDLTGCVMGMPKEIESFVSLAELDMYEQNNALPSTSHAPSGGRRTIRERKLLIAERTA